MAFKSNQVLAIPELAAHVGLASPEFRVDRILKGGMGECVRVVQGQHSFGLKIIQDDIVDDAEAWHRYLREVRLWTTLSACDGVVEAFCAIRINELPVVCCRWMNGGSLRRYLRNRSPEFFFSVMARIVGTLAWTNEKHSVIHRDLKPDNILLDQTGLAFVSDWGLARPVVGSGSELQDHSSTIRENVHNPALTAAGSFIGTVSYASPEQLLGNPELDHRTDIYSLGCLMYEWEAGNCPFTGTSADEIALKHLLDLPAALGTSPTKTTFGIEDVVRRCLDKDPKKRLPDYPSLDLALAEAARTRGVQYERFRPSLRYRMPMVGAGEYRLRSRATGVWNEVGTHGIVELSDIEEYLREAEVLVAAGDYAKAAEIYGSLFVPEAVNAVPDYPHNQYVTINYADCLMALGRADDAIKTLECLNSAQRKPAAYFVNLSLAQIRQSDYRAAASTAIEGLQFYSADPDLTGNLLVAQTALGMFSDAAETAKTRLTYTRDVLSLHEVAALHCKYARSVRELDWPLALKNLKYAVSLLREARDLNPRHLPVRMQLPVALEEMTAYAQCSDEIAAAKDLPWHFSDRVFLMYLFARCLDRVNDHKGCWEFCDRWLMRIAEVQLTNPVPRHNVVRLERVRAMTVADGFCIGKMKNGERVIAPLATEFFADVVHAEDLREAVDFCYLARLHEWMEETERAYTVLTEAQALYPEYWEIPFQHAAFRVRAGDYESAIQDIQLAAELAPWNSQTWQLWGKILGGLGRLSEAERAYKRAEEVMRVREQLAEDIEAI